MGFFSHFDLVLVVEDFESLAILDNLAALFEFELEDGVGHDTNPDVDGLNVVLDLRDSLLDVRERGVIRERLACIINLALHSG